MSDVAGLSVVVVSHTHWDREWYHPAVRFRQRLVALIDALLERPLDAEHSVLLDGQAIVLEDYLAVRPEARAELSARLRAGALEAGPWLVLADALIPSGEALVRNLLAGRRVLNAFRAEAPPVLYCPDSFGHPAALPALAAGFGLPMAVVWRGYGGRRWPAGDVARWHAPDGSVVLLYHLARSGYELGVSLPTDSSSAADRWRDIREQLGDRATLGVALLPNGADHHVPQADVDAAIDVLARAASPASIRRGSLRSFAREIQDRAGGTTLPKLSGELRDSYGYTWTLQGTLASRAHQKRMNAMVERSLVREAEPWSALARWMAGAHGRGHLVRAAWRTLLECHPHDTLCGCSSDAVAQAVDVRLAEARSQADGIVEDALGDLVGHDRVSARGQRDRWVGALVLRNPTASLRSGVAEVELVSAIADEPVGPGSAERVPPVIPRRLPVPIPGGLAVQILESVVRRDRVESPAHYPDNDLVAATRALVWAPPVSGYATVSFALGSRRRGKAPDIVNPVRTTPRTLENGRVAVEVDADGAVRLRALQPAVEIGRLIQIEDVHDGGDLYTPSPRGVPARTSACTRVRLRHRGPLRGALETEWRVRRPGAKGALAVTVTLSLDADSSIVRLDVRGENGWNDHRVRIVLATGVEGSARITADAAFGPVSREPVVVPPEDAVMETPPPTAPLHRYVTASGASHGVSVLSDGLAEYEAADGEIAVTLLRAVGELSRNDLPERPGHAGWPLPTPAAQSRGPFAARLGVLVHPAAGRQALPAIGRAVDDFLLPLTGTTLRDALRVPPPTAGVELAGEDLTVSAVKDSEDGEWLVLRCVNVSERSVAGGWRFWAPVAEARYARLDETPGGACEVNGDRISFVAGPRAAVTVLARLSPGA